jgi:hypothetical protein
MYILNGIQHVNKLFRIIDNMSIYKLKLIYYINKKKWSNLIYLIDLILSKVKQQVKIKIKKKSWNKFFLFLI